MQGQDLNIVSAKQIIKAFMYKLVIYKMTAMTHNFCNFLSLDGKEIDCELQTVIVNNNNNGYIYVLFLHAAHSPFIKKTV